MNTKMIRYILGKMMGVEGVLLLLPAFVSLIYQEFCGVYFLIPTVILFVAYFLFGRKSPANRTIWKRRNGYCRQCVDFMVFIWGVTVLSVRLYP